MPEISIISLISGYFFHLSRLRSLTSSFSRSFTNWSFKGYLAVLSARTFSPLLGLTQTPFSTTFTDSDLLGVLKNSFALFRNLPLLLFAYTTTTEPVSPGATGVFVQPALTHPQYVRTLLITRLSSLSFFTINLCSKSFSFIETVPKSNSYSETLATDSPSPPAETFCPPKNDRQTAANKYFKALFINVHVQNKIQQ